MTAGTNFPQAQRGKQANRWQSHHQFQEKQIKLLGDKSLNLSDDIFVQGAGNIPGVDPRHVDKPQLLFFKVDIVPPQLRMFQITKAQMFAGVDFGVDGPQKRSLLQARRR